MPRAHVFPFPFLRTDATLLIVPSLAAGRMRRVAGSLLDGSARAPGLPRVQSRTWNLERLSAMVVFRVAFTVQPRPTGP